MIWADGRAYQPACDAHVKNTQERLTKKNGSWAELAGVQDFSNVVDLVSSTVYPDLERKPGGPDNWIEQVGGLPDYIERIAKHLHYERGYTISRAIATAVNTVKRWATGGAVAVGRPERVTPATAAKAAKALAEWEAKKARARALPGTPRGSGRRRDLANTPGTVGQPGVVIDLALTKDGRQSFKRQGKWGHGFVPLDEAAKRAKAKGSPIAAKRIERLYSKVRARKVKPTKQEVVQSEGGGSQRVNDVAQLTRTPLKDASQSQRTKLDNKELSKGGGRTKRSIKAWADVPESQKTIRNGKRYVLVTFNGKQQLTEWVGPNENTVQTANLGDRILKNITEAQMAKLTSGQLRRLLRVPGQDPTTKTRIYAYIKKLQDQDKGRRT